MKQAQNGWVMLSLSSGRVKRNKVLVAVLTIEGERLQQKHSAHHQGELQGPGRGAGGGEEWWRLPDGLAGVALLVELHYHQGPDEIPEDGCHECSEACKDVY